MCYTPRTQNKLVLRTIGILIEEDIVHGYLSLPRRSHEVKGYRQGNYIVEDVFKNVYVSVFVLLVYVSV